MAERASTPPPPASGSGAWPSTPEKLKQIELNRLRAKARQRQREEDAAASSVPNKNNKRALVNAMAPANSASPAVAKGPEPLKRDSRLMGNYVEYDLSKMVNSKGGFLVNEDDKGDKELREKEKQRERERARQNIEPAVNIEPGKNPECSECGSIDIDHQFRKVFKCNVCNKCKNDKPEKYSLLTKTECKEDYLLTDPELRDSEVMPHLLKANPHKSTYSNMMLFLRLQVEEFAWKKWGSPEGLDAEWERRQNEKKKKKNKKFEEGLKELRKKTREGVWQRRRDEEHKHIFSTVQGSGNQVCHQCGFTIEAEEL